MLPITNISSLNPRPISNKLKKIVSLTLSAKIVQTLLNGKRYAGYIFFLILIQV